MSSIAIGTFVKFNNQNDRAYQNFFIGESQTWNGVSYLFSGFGYSGSTIDLEAANISASLVFAVNQLSLNLAKEAADNRWIVEIESVWLNPETLATDKSYLKDTFMVTGFDHDTMRLNMRLSSPLDAVAADAPRRRLTEDLVGALPSTGQIALL